MAIGRDEAELPTVTVRATKQQTDKLLGWAEPFTKRTWAIESAGGLGYLLAQQLVDAGEHVLDVPARCELMLNRSRHPSDTGLTSWLQEYSNRDQSPDEQ